MITIDPRAHWCPRHLEPFRARWPRGYLPASMALLEEAVRRPEIARAAGGDADRLDPVLREYGPLCCLAGDDATARWTSLALADDLGPMAAALDLLRATPSPASAVGAQHERRDP